LKLGDTLPVKILFGRKPVAARVQTTFDGKGAAGHRFVVRTESGQDGTAQISIDRPGLWLVRVKHDVSEARDGGVTHLRASGKGRAQIGRAERLNMRRHQAELLETQARVDVLDPELQQSQQVRGIAAGSGRADCHHLLVAIDAQGAEPQRAGAGLARLQQLGHVAQQIGHDLGDRFGCADRSRSRRSTIGTAGSSRSVIGSAVPPKA
jgi:Domain of unknown function (DUF4198)